MPRITREDLIRAEKDYRAGKYGDDPHDDRRRLPRLTPKFASWGAARLSMVCIALLHTVAFPPYDVTVAAYLFAVPVFLYALREPKWRDFLAVTFTGFLLSWLILLNWLWATYGEGGWVVFPAWFALATVMACFPTAWCAAVRWVVPRAPWSDLLSRLMAVAGLAGLWAVQEWVRSWIFTGFPWLTLATSQWKMPMMLQGASIGGGWLVGFMIIFFSLALASYLQRMWLWVKERRGRFSPEFYVAVLVMFAATIGVFVSERDGSTPEPWFRAGFVQPYIPQSQKWDPAKAATNLGVLEQETKRVVAHKPDLILWPEAVTPMALFDGPGMETWVRRVANEVELPVLFGALALEDEPGAASSAEVETRWTNGVFLAEPGGGLSPQIYRKRHLVPFGEYVPLRRVLPFLKKFVPIGGDITPGTEPSPILVNTSVGGLKIAPLICYEDVFPDLARASVLAGADLLFVGTNNAWYGESGMAEQHAAHSVVRAVETRRPVLRNGNGGWSGWIDENGVTRFVATRKGKGVYFRGVDYVDVQRNPRWVGRESFYVQHGDWFVIVGAALALAMVVLLRSSRFRFDPEKATAVRVGGGG